MDEPTNITPPPPVPPLPVAPVPTGMTLATKIMIGAVAVAVIGGGVFLMLSNSIELPVPTQYTQDGTLQGVHYDMITTKSEQKDGRESPATKILERGYLATINTDTRAIRLDTYNDVDNMSADKMPDKIVFRFFTNEDKEPWAVACIPSNQTCYESPTYEALRAEREKTFNSNGLELKQSPPETSYNTIDSGPEIFGLPTKERKLSSVTSANLSYNDSPGSTIHTEVIVETLESDDERFSPYLIFEKSNEISEYLGYSYPKGFRLKVNLVKNSLTTRDGEEVLKKVNLKSDVTSLEFIPLNQDTFTIPKGWLILPAPELSD